MNIIMKMSIAFIGVVVLLSGSLLSAQEATIQHGNVGGYTGASTKGGKEEFNAGFSFYSAAWPLLRKLRKHRGAP